MEKDQVKILIKHVQKLLAQKRTKEQSLAALQSSGILTKKGNFTKNYKNLSKLFSRSKGK